MIIKFGGTICISLGITTEEPSPELTGSQTVASLCKWPKSKKIVFYHDSGIYDYHSYFVGLQ